MKDVKILLIIRDCSVELAEKIQKTINEYNVREKEK